MRVKGQPSWRFGHGDADDLSRVLFIRDTAMLPVPAADEVPPPLLGDRPAHPGLLTEADRGTAAGQWLRWWRELLGQRVARETTRRADDARRHAEQDALGIEELRRQAEATAASEMARLRARTSRMREIFDPPDFAHLAGAPELRRAAIAGFAASRGWPGSEREGLVSPGRHFPWQLTRDAAEETAAALGLPIDRMDARADVLEVAGPWSCVIGAGYGLCSDETATDLRLAAALLRELFASGAAAARAAG